MPLIYNRVALTLAIFPGFYVMAYISGSAISCQKLQYFIRSLAIILHSIDFTMVQSLAAPNMHLSSANGKLVSFQHPGFLSPGQAFSKKAIRIHAWTFCPVVTEASTFL